MQKHFGFVCVGQELAKFAKNPHRIGLDFDTRNSDEIHVNASNITTNCELTRKCGELHMASLNVIKTYGPLYETQSSPNLCLNTDIESH